MVENRETLQVALLVGRQVTSIKQFRISYHCIHEII